MTIAFDCIHFIYRCSLFAVFDTVQIKLKYGKMFNDFLRCYFNYAIMSALFFFLFDFLRVRFLILA